MPLMFSRISVLSHPVLRVVGTPPCFSELRQTTRSRSEKASGELFCSWTHMISPAIFTASTFHDPVVCPVVRRPRTTRLIESMDRMTRTAKTPAQTPSTIETRSPPETPEKMTPRERTACHWVFGLGLGFKGGSAWWKGGTVVPIVHCPV